MESDNPRVTLDMLLEHREWLRRLALSVAGDANLADDLEQDAWVAAMRRPPREPGAIRGWFRQVVKNAFRQRLRGDERRDRRERSRPVPPDEPSTDEIVARAESQRLLVERVFALPEPYKTTILLRYFEGLDSASVGERMGCPANTVRVRTKRALVLLQQDLDGAYGSRHAWVALLLPGLGLPLPAAAGGASSSPSGPHAARPATPPRGTMTAPWKPLAAVGGLAAVALLAVLSWTALSTDAPGGTSDTSTTTDGAADAATSDGPERGARRDAVERDESEVADAGHPGGATLSGEVRLVVGDEPATEVEVELLGAEGQVIRTTTGPDGRFRVTGLPPALGYSVAAAKTGFATARSESFDLAPRQTHHLDTLWLDRPSRAVVRVLDPLGEPAPEALVEIYASRRTVSAADWRGELPEPLFTAETDASGTATLDGLPLGVWTFRATHAEHAPAGLPAQPLDRGGVELSVVLHLGAAHSLEGTVTGPDGAPLADAVLLMLPPRDAVPSRTPEPVSPLRIETRTDTDGHYRFDALPHGHHSLSVLPEGGLPCRIGVVEIPTLDRFDVRLDGGRLFGVVTDAESGDPLPGAQVRAGVWRRHSPTFLTATTDEAGRYEIQVPLGGFVNGPPTGDNQAVATEVHFQVELEGYAMPPQSGVHQWRGDWVIDGRSTRWDVTLSPAAALSGQVTGPDGPVPGADVRIELWHEVLGSIPYTARTDGEGRYRVPGLLPGRARGFVTQEGLVQSPAPLGPTWRSGEQPDAVVTVVPRSGEATLDLTLVDGIAVTGRVRDEQGQGVAAVTVEEVGGAARTTTGDDGSFRLGGLTPGREHTLRFWRDGYADVRTLWTGKEGETELDVELTATGEVSGVVSAPDGELPRGTFVQVAPASAALDGRYEIASIWTTAPRAPVRSDGGFSLPIPWFEGASADGIVVRAVAPDLAPAITDRLAVEPGRDVMGVELELETGHTLRGSVVAADGSGPIVGARVEFANAELPPALEQGRDWSLTGLNSHPFEWKAVTDEQGRFFLRGLPEWRYELRISAKGYHGTMLTAEVPEQEEVSAQLPPTRSIAGVVRFADGEPAGHVEVRAHRATGGLAGRTVAEADGSFEVPWLSEGQFRLEVRSPADRPLDVVPLVSESFESDTTDLELVVERAEGRIEGRCTTTSGAVVPGAWITVKPQEGGAQPVTFRAGMDGRFALTGLSGGPFTVIAVADRSAGGPEDFGRSLTVEVADVELGARDLALVFQEALPLAGSVRRADGTPPSGSLRLSAVRLPDGRWTRMAGVAADGAFRLENLLPGEYELSLVDVRTGAELTLEGSARFTTGTEDADLVVATTGRLSGQVRDPDGDPRPQVWVRATGPDGKAAWAQTGDDGSFELDVTDPAATYRLEALDHRLGRDQAERVRPGGTPTRLTLRPAAALTLRLLATDDEPVRNADLDLVPTSGGPPLRIRTDADGRFTSRAVAPGTYRVELRNHDGRPLDQPVPCGTITPGTGETTLRAALE